MNKKAFYDHVRSRLYSGYLSQEQVDGLELLLEGGGMYRLPLRRLAYVLATVYHETAKRMQPIDEFGTDHYYHNMYDINGKRPHVARELGNLSPGDGVRYHGRGLVQLTGRRNYATFGGRLGLDLINNPKQANDPKVAVRILFTGMIDGLFTGKKLEDYIQEGWYSYEDARRIVNGTDKAALIATYAKEFAYGLSNANYDASAIPVEKPEKKKNNKKKKEDHAMRAFTIGVIVGAAAMIYVYDADLRSTVNNGITGAATAIYEVLP